jgi:dsDNA-specific endonuclease/ATPase MutS2
MSDRLDVRREDARHRVHAMLHIPIESELDLHAFAPRDIASVVEEYVNAAVAAGLRQVRVVHGRGRGVQRGIVQATLDRHPLVAEFWDDTASHLGATLVRLATPSSVE